MLSVTSLRFALALAMSAITLACSEQDNPVASTTTGAAGGGGTGGVFDPGGDVTTYQMDAGPFMAQPGEEQTVCITKNLKNAEGGYVRRFRATLTSGSHHMILYRSTATTEDVNPTPCQAFAGLLSGDAPVFIAQQPDAVLTFPKEGDVPVAFEIQPNQMFRVEVHYINTTPEPIDISGAAIIDTISLSETVIPSDLAFWGTNNLNGGGSPPSNDIPPNSTGDSGPRFQRALGNTKTFAATTHQHHFGTRMRIWYAQDVTDINKDPVVESTDWANPSLEIFGPSLDFPSSGGNFYADMGFAYRCEYNNPTPVAVSFGESFNDEMCFLWHYYYPSQGFHICFNGFCQVQ